MRGGSHPAVFGEIFHFLSCIETIFYILADLESAVFLMNSCLIRELIVRIFEHECGDERVDRNLPTRIEAEL
jgi:hypothetical protein